MRFDIYVCRTNINNPNTNRSSNHNYYSAVSRESKTLDHPPFLSPPQTSNPNPHLPPPPPAFHSFSLGEFKQPLATMLALTSERAVLTLSLQLARALDRGRSPCAGPTAWRGQTLGEATACVYMCVREREREGALAFR